MLTVDGTAFHENDLAVLRAIDSPMAPDEAVRRAVLLGANPALARGVLERLWIVGAVEKDRRKVQRSAFGEAVVLMGAGM